MRDGILGLLCSSRGDHRRAFHRRGKGTQSRRAIRTSERPILRSNRIDPHVFAKSNGELYLYWKEDSNGIWPQMLSDLLSLEPDIICELFDIPEHQRTACFISTLAPWTMTLDPMERFFVHQPLLLIA